MADYEYIKSTGVIVPDTSDLLIKVQDEFKAAFGLDLVVTADTPQGVLIVAETLARAGILRNNAALANQINPNLAGGSFLDAICALTGLSRNRATRSLVTATLSGVAGTIIPEGVRAQTVGQDLFQSVSTVSIGVGGTVDVVFQSVEFGPIGALPGDLNQIVDGVLGWEAITNANAAVVGQEEQSDQSLRQLRKNTLALQGISLVEAQVSDLYATEGVKSLQFRENILDTTAVIDGVTMEPHSIYACVDGGTDSDVAMSLLENKSGGAQWTNGAGDPQSVIITEPASGQPYTVLFDRPDLIPIQVRATVKNVSSLQNPTEAVKDSIMDFVNGLQEGEVGLTVGTSVSCFELSAAVNREAPGVYVQNMETKKVSGGSFSNAEIAIDIWELATLDRSNITVVIA